MNLLLSGFDGLGPLASYIVNIISAFLSNLPLASTLNCFGPCMHRISGVPTFVLLH